MVGAWFYQHVARDRSCSLQLLWWQWAFLKNVGVVSSCAPCGVTTLHVFPCWSRTPPSWLGHSFTKAVTWKHEKQSRCITWSLCLEGAVSDRSIAEVQDRTLRDEWLAKRSAGSDSRLPSWFRVSCSLCCSSSWDIELVEQKSTMCQFIFAPCVCAARIPQKHKALRSPGLCQCMGDKNAETWNGRRGVCLEKQTERLGSFQEAVPGLLTYSSGCQIVLQKSVVAAGAANRYSSWLYSPVTHKCGTRSCL